MEEKLERILGALRVYAGNDDLGVDWEVFEREMHTADRNRATAYLMRSQRMLGGDVEAILALYLQQCSVSVTCHDIAVMAATLSGGGVNPLTGERALPRAHIRDVLSVMYTCGMYDAAGQWAYQVGVPAERGQWGDPCGRPGQAGPRGLLTRTRLLWQQRARSEGMPRGLRTAWPPRLRD